MSYASLASALVVDDLARHYPFAVGDFFDWIVNGFAWRGYDVAFTARPPLFPWLVAGLHALGVLGWLPVVMLFLTHATPCALYAVLRTRYGCWAALVASLTLLLNERWLLWGAQLQAEALAAPLLFGAWAMLVLARGRTLWAVGSGVLAALAYLCHQVGALFVVPVVAAWLLSRGPGQSPETAGEATRLERRTAIWVLGLLGVAISGFMVFRRVVIGTAFDASISHWRLVRPHTSSIADYLWLLLAIAGPGLVIVALLGGIRFFRSSSRRRRIDVWAVSLLSLLAALAVFFVLLYDYTAPRFLAYALPFLCVLAAEGLSSLRSRAVFALVAALVLLASVLPQPSVQQHWEVTLLPGLALRAPREPAPSGSELVRVASAEASLAQPLDQARSYFDRLPWREVANAPPTERFAGPSPDTLAAPGRMLYLFEAGGSSARYHRTTRTASLLRRRVSYVPWDAIPRWWLSAAGGESVVREGQAAGQLVEAGLYRLMVPELGQERLVAVPHAVLQAPEKVDSSPPSAQERRQALGRARDLVQMAGADPVLVLVSPEDPELELELLYFVLIFDGELLVPEPSGVEGARRMLEPLPEPAGPDPPEIEQGTLRVVRRQGAGRRWMVIEEGASSNVMLPSL